MNKKQTKRMKQLLVRWEPTGQLTRPVSARALAKVSK